MRLGIDTTTKERLELFLTDDKTRVLERRKFATLNSLSEEILPLIEKFLQSRGVTLQDVKQIFVNPGPGGFSSTRTGVAVANALAFALRVPLAEWPSRKIKKLVLPRYGMGPNITQPKNF